MSVLARNETKKNSMKNSFLTLVAFFCLFSLEVNAKIKLPSIIASNMVLQRDASVKIWGWAKPDEQITIQASWVSKKIKVVTDSKGHW